RIMNSRNRAETQRGNEENEERESEVGEDGETRRREDKEKHTPPSFCPLVPLSPCLPISHIHSPAPNTLRPPHSLALCLRAATVMVGASASVEREAEFESGAHSHRLSVLNSGLKAYSLGCLDGGFGQSVRQPAQQADVVDAPVGAEDNV